MVVVNPHNVTPPLIGTVRVSRMNTSRSGGLPLGMPKEGKVRLQRWGVVMDMPSPIAKLGPEGMRNRLS